MWMQSDFWVSEKTIGSLNMDGRGKYKITIVILNMDAIIVWDRRADDREFEYAAWVNQDNDRHFECGRKGGWG
jgi:hypothetical protein